MKKEMVDKEIRHHENSFGVASVVLGILSLVLFMIPVVGLVLGIVGFTFAFKQNKFAPNAWSKAGLWLCGIGIVVGVVWGVYYIKSLLAFSGQYQEQLAALQGTAG